MYPIKTLPLGFNKHVPFTLIKSCEYRYFSLCVKVNLTYLFWPFWNIVWSKYSKSPYISMKLNSYNIFISRFLFWTGNWQFLFIYISKTDIKLLSAKNLSSFVCPSIINIVPVKLLFCLSRLFRFGLLFWIIHTIGQEIKVTLIYDLRWSHT